MGIGADIKSKAERKLYSKTLESLNPTTSFSFGLIPEFIGRLPVVAVLHELDRRSSH